MLAMSYDDFKFLRFIDFKDFNSWSVKYLTDTDFNYNNQFDLVSISSFLERDKTSVDIEDEKNYKRVTIKINNGGVFLRDIEIGKNIGTKKQFQIKSGQFLLSKIDARNGAFGVVTDSVDKAIITGNFWTYNVDYKKVLPSFLSLITTTNKFMEFCQKNSAGTTNRHYLQEDKFLSQKIPLPSLDEQQALVSAYQAKISQAEQLEQQAKQLEQDIENYLFDELGITINEAKTFETGKLQFIEFKDLHKWGVSVNQQGVTAETIFQSNKYPNVSILDYFIINPTTKPPQDKEIAFVPMASVSDTYGEIVKQESKKLEKGYTRFAENDIIWARITPCMENGKSAIATNLINGFGFGSTEFHVIRQKNTKFDKELLSLLLRTKRLRQVATTYFTGSAGQQRVPKEFLELLTLPAIENMDFQKSIIHSVRLMHTKQRENLEKAQQLRQQAIQDFETAIFK